MIEHIASVTPLNGAIDGARRPRKYRSRQRGQSRSGRVEVIDLSPEIRAELVRQRVDLLCVEVLDRHTVVIHNNRYWR